MSVSKRLEGKTVLITGASSGIGRSTALEFARTSPQHLKLILTARRIDRLQELATGITKEFPGVKVHPVQLDVSNPEEVRGLLSSLPAEFKEVDVLVNNAYVFLPLDLRGAQLTVLPVASSKASPKPPKSQRKTSTSCSRQT